MLINKIYKEQKSKEDIRNKKPTTKKNAVYKNVDITINKRKLNKEKDYTFKMVSNSFYWS